VPKSADDPAPRALRPRLRRAGVADHHVEAPPLPPAMSAELQAIPAAMPVCLGVDSNLPCASR